MSNSPLSMRLLRALPSSSMTHCERCKRRARRLIPLEQHWICPTCMRELMRLHHLNSVEVAEPAPAAPLPGG